MAALEKPAKLIPALPGSQEEIQELLCRAAKGDESCLPTLRAFFDDRGERAIEVFGGDLARIAEDSMINHAAGKHLAVKEAMHRKLIAIRAELAGPNPSSIERLLAERAALCWFSVNQYEASYAQQRGEFTLSQAEAQQRRIDRAHHRFLTAVRTLAQVRKLALPALQVNIGANQVNVAQRGD